MLLENSLPPLITFLKVRPFITINRQKLYNLTVNRQNLKRNNYRQRQSHHPIETLVK